MLESERSRQSSVVNDWTNGHVCGHGWPPLWTRLPYFIETLSPKVLVCVDRDTQGVPWVSFRSWPGTRHFKHLSFITLFRVISCTDSFYRSIVVRHITVIIMFFYEEEEEIWLGPVLFWSIVIFTRFEGCGTTSADTRSLYYGSWVTSTKVLLQTDGQLECLDSRYTIDWTVASLDVCFVCIRRRCLPLFTDVSIDRLKTSLCFMSAN